MPKYRVELDDGRKFDVEADSPPSEQDVLALLGSVAPAQNAAPPGPGPAQRVLGGPVNTAPVSDVSGKPDEPSTFWGGFGQSLKNQVLGATVQNPAMQGVAHPGQSGESPLETAGELGAMALPTGAPGIVNYLRGVLRLTRDAAVDAPALTHIGPVKIPNPIGMVNSAERIAGQQAAREAINLAGGPANAPMPRILPAPSQAMPGALRMAERPAPLTQGTTVEAFHPEATKLPEQPPKVVPEGAGPQPTARPHLSAQEFLRLQRQEFGSEQAARNLVPNPSPEMSRADSVNWIKDSAPMESSLPNAARRQIEQQLSTMTPEQAWDYVQRAPNGPAREYFMQRLRAGR